MASRSDETSRLHQALIDLCFERGFKAIGPAELVERAGVGRAAFERRFDDLEDLFLFAFLAETERCRAEWAPRSRALAPWRERIRATLYALYRFLAADRRLAHFLVVEWPSAGERTRLAAGRQLEALFDLIDEGRREPGAPGSLTRTTAEATGGGVYNQIYAALAQDRRLPPDAEMVPQLLYCVFLPYLGDRLALAELHRPPPPDRRPEALPSGPSAASLALWQRLPRSRPRVAPKISVPFPEATTGSPASRS